MIQLQQKTNRVVQSTSPHRILRGDHMGERKYDATYKYGNTTVHVVAPKSMSDEDKEQIIHGMHIAGWAIIDEIVDKENPEQLKEVGLIK